MTQPVGLQTHFNAPIDDATLDQIRDFGFRWARIDAQVCDHATMVNMIADVLAASLMPLPIVYDDERLEVLGVLAPLDVEWGNEPDGDIAPATYRPLLDRACAIAAAHGLRLWAPAISNLDRDSLLWLERVREVGGGWPEGLYGLSAHRYGDGTFDYAHPPATTRTEEVEALRALCDGRPFLITEFGYPSTPVSAMTRRPKRTKWLRPDLHLTEAEQAENIAKEWAFWATFPDCRAPFDYQINDGIQADESYGIRRCAPDGTLTDWKPAAYTVPKEDPMPPLLANILPNTVFSKADLVAVPGRPNDYSVRFPTGADTLLSPKTTGVHELRTMDYLGNLDETCRVAGGLVYFPNVAGQRFAWPLVE